MVAATKLMMSDLARQRRFATDLRGELTPRHTVGDAVEWYLDRADPPERGRIRWAAFSRGVRLDAKRPLNEVPDQDVDWLILPEVSAG